MPTGKNWINFIYVNLGFLAQIFALYFFTMINEIQKDWPKYRCNPMFMPLSNNISEDFTYCVQNMQTNYMGYLLSPLNYITSGLTDLGNELSTNIAGIRDMLSIIRTFIGSIIENVFGVFLNLVIAFQKITISIKDLVSKIIGIVVTLMYVLDGSNKTMVSMWHGPMGQMVQNLAKPNQCFHPKTKIILENGKICFMKDVPVGSILENGSRVRSVMRIDNFGNEDLYKIVGKGVLGESIFVTGSHYIKNNSGEFIKVQDYPGAVKQCELFTEEFSCLITDNHKICIGDCTFWDWEDYLLH